MLLPEDLDDFRGYVRAFIDREVAPHDAQWTRDRSVPRSLHAAAGSAGLLGLKYSTVWGGSNRAYAFTRVMLDEFGRSGFMGSLLSLVLQAEFSTPHLALYGGDELQRRFLPRAIAGDWILSIAMTEPESGSDLVNLRTTARGVDGGFVVSGTKWMIGNASLADAFCVVCRAADQTERQMPQLSMLLVDATTHGCTVGRPLEKTGLHATPNCIVSFDECYVPAAHVLGRPGLAIPQGLVAGAYERIALALIAAAAARAGWEQAARFLATRQTGGQALVERAPWRHRLTEDYIAMQGVERIVSDAATSLEGGRPDQKLVLMAKIAATETCQRVLAHASQACGARGFLAEEVIGRLQADARALTIGGGASEALIDALSKLVLPPPVRAQARPKSALPGAAGSSL